MVYNLFRFFLAFNSTSLILIIYWIKCEYHIPYCLIKMPDYCSYLLYIVIMVSLTRLSLVLRKYLAVADIKKESITNIEYANDSFLPSYLGYFFVALDVPDNGAIYFVYFIILIFTFLSQTLYFNPIFLLFGYQFYYLTNTDNVRIFLITKQDLRIPKNVEFDRIIVINNYTYIET